jgi:hypothetical protein
MQHVLDAPSTNRHSQFESVDETVKSIQHQINGINTALRQQQIYREQGDNESMLRIYKTAADALDKIGEVYSQKTNELIAELWERAGVQLRGTRNYSEYYCCFTNAMAHYKQANKHEKFLQAFRNLYHS